MPTCGDRTIAKIAAEVKYKGSVDSVQAKGTLGRKAPVHSWGDAVLIPSKGQTAKISGICRHYGQKKYYYYLEDLSGRPIKRRYFEDELKDA